jgi:hypothetical protein
MASRVPLCWYRRRQSTLMANPVPNLVAPEVAERQEFWKPAAPRLEVAAAGEAPTTPCGECGGSLVRGSRICPTCGANSQAAEAGLHSDAPQAPNWPELAALQRWFARMNWSLAALVSGCACILAAVVTGFVFNATTLVDWQAVQLWRIEWLLAAIAFLLAGILVKKK